MSDPAPPGGRAFHGRRKGKALRQGQEEFVRTLLPRLRVPVAPWLPHELDASTTYGEAMLHLAAEPPRLDDLAALFPGRPTEIALEIGFGGGEHLAADARAHPDTGFIGCEPYLNGMAKMLATVADERLTNIRLWDRDVVELLPRLPDASIDRVAILYPDPWPKRRQRKRRLVSDALLAELARLLRPGGTLRFATDIDDYAGWTLARALRSPAFRWTARRPDDWRRPWPDWPGTRYEAKALKEGRAPSYLTFERIAGVGQFE